MAETSTVAFGRYLRELRERRGLSLLQVCELSQRSAEPFHKGTLSKLERGKQALSMFRLGPLTRIYEISADALIERMELDAEVDRLGGPVTDGLDYEALWAAGREALQRSSRKWDAYAYLREAQWVAPAEQRIYAWINLATAIRSLGKNALALHELQALESAGGLEPIERAWIHERMAHCCRSLGEMKHAADYADSAIAQSRAVGDLRSLAYAYSTRARAAIDDEQWEVADGFLLKALAAYRDSLGQESHVVPSPLFEVQEMLALAECSFRLGNSSRTRRLTLTAKKLAEEHELPAGLAIAELVLGLLDDADGDPERALARWRKAAGIAAKLDSPQLAFAAEVEMFRQAKEAGDVLRARACRRRLERLAPWMSRHKPSYRKFKQLIDDKPSHVTRDVQGGVHDEIAKIAVASRAAGGGDDAGTAGVPRRGRAGAGRPGGRRASGDGLRITRDGGQ